ncbi:MAG: hypothetical protein J6M31_01385 [Bacteroidales bacterium]|nr:hypothetical protein [Bacteroidales bacterium]
MAKVSEILAKIDEKAPYAMVIEASVRDYCVLALKFLRGEADFQRYFETRLPSAMPALEAELSALKYAGERYCTQLYKPAEEALLSDAIADLAFAQAERLTLVTPSTPQADDRERADVYIVAVYTLFALALHGRADFAVLFLEAWNNFVQFASARTVRKHYDRSWTSRYVDLFYPLG